MAHRIISTDPPCVVCRHLRPDGELRTVDGVPGRWVCRDCTHSTPRCDNCGLMSPTPIQAAADALVCHACARQWSPCVSCHGLTAPSRCTDTDDPVCSYCANTHFAQCYTCTRYSASSRYVSGGVRVCTRCVDRMCDCDECGTLYRPGYSCDRCSHPVRVWNYSYKPDPRFHGEGPLYLGMELEIIVPRDDHDDCVALATDHLGGLGYLKQDASIRPSGFELVTHPMSYDYAIERFPWQLLEKLNAYGCHTDRTVGLHVHASRAGFDNPAHIYRWLKLLYRNESDVVTLARRRSLYAPFDPRARAKARHTAKSHAHALGLDRHQAINPHPRSTLELRVFASSLDPRQVQAALAFTAASIDYTRGLRVADVHDGAWTWPRFTTWAAGQPRYQPLTTELGVLACAC